MLSDLSNVSSQNSDTYSEQFFERYHNLLYTRDADAHYLNDKASWLLPQPDSNLAEVRRLNKQLADLQYMRP